MLGVAAAPVITMAQTTVYNAEVYTIGTKINYRNCTPDSAFITGGAGSSQLWDYTNIAWDSTSTTVRVMSPYFAGNGASFSVHLVNGSDTFITDVKPTLTGNYVVASYSNNLLYGFPQNMYTMGIRTTKNPAHYGEQTLDSLMGSYPQINLDQTGYSSLSVDAYGILMLPNATYNNVLRVQRVVDQYSILPLLGVSFETKTVSYMWYDSDHAMPLMQVDSFNSMGNFLAARVRYMGDPKPVDTTTTGINNVVSNQQNMSAHIVNNTVTVHDNFEAGKNYELKMYNIAGQVVYTTSFTAAQENVTLDANTNLVPGMYIIAVQQKDNSQWLHIAKANK